MYLRLLVSDGARCVVAALLGDLLQVREEALGALALERGADQAVRGRRGTRVLAARGAVTRGRGGRGVAHARDRVRHLHLQLALHHLLVSVQHLPVDHHHGVHVAGRVRRQHLSKNICILVKIFAGSSGACVIIVCRLPGRYIYNSFIPRQNSDHLLTLASITIIYWLVVVICANCLVASYYLVTSHS